jgi:DNA-binding MarR family transcriptional regulator
MSNTYQQQDNNNSASSALQFFITLAKMQAIITRRFDHMGSMVGFTDFAILYHLNLAEDKKLRRIDLADKVGLTASGITRLLPPLEKIGLVGREANPRDARSSFVTLTTSGQRVFQESLERAEMVATDMLPSQSAKNIEKCSELLEDIRRRSV